MARVPLLAREGIFTGTRQAGPASEKKSQTDSTILQSNLLPNTLHSAPAHFPTGHRRIIKLPFYNLIKTKSVDLT